ncbi:hypothetical protein EVAR_83868_1 [Eumeta japonica]|uniref:Uncharacterized protein n=1 Tax=Eumeta variegata TaxID=151549 RepID=A0A4C1URM2_EUMVA|nr:hypothetical protein EVAR_83868_1 [Eumeta japonica]
MRIRDSKKEGDSRDLPTVNADILSHTEKVVLSIPLGLCLVKRLPVVQPGPCRDSGDKDVDSPQLDPHWTRDVLATRSMKENWKTLCTAFG